jgi:hypothetical protein
MPEANPVSSHNKAADAVLKAGIGLAKAKFSEDAQDELLLGEEAGATRYSQVPNVGEQTHHGRSQAPDGLHGEGREAVCAPLVLEVFHLLLGVPPGGSSPAVPCRARVDEGDIPHLELV